MKGKLMRAFIAVALTPGVRENIAGLQEQLKGSRAGVKWVEPGNLHLTLRFLGDIPEDRLDHYYRAIGGGLAGHAPFNLTLSHLGTFPPRGKPRVLWVGVQQGQEALRRLAAGISSSLGQARLLDEEGRRFSAHLTLGRVRSPGGLDSLARLLEEKKDFYGGEMPVEEVRLVKSTLTARGSVYRDLKRFYLTARQD